MSVSFNYQSEPVFPWSSTDNDESFKRIVKWVLAIFIIIGAIIPWLPSPEVEKKSLKQVSPHLAKLITQKRLQKPKPPKPRQLKKKTEKKKVKPKPATKKQIKALKKAQNSGLMAMSKDIQNLQDMFSMTSLETNKPVKSQPKSRQNSTQSSVLTTRAKASSGGIDTSKLSQTTGNTKLANRQGSNVSSNIASSSKANNSTTGTSSKARGLEELTLVFDRYKGALQSIYQRALRKDPTLQGKVVFELTINGAGQVIKCRIVSSELGSKSLERRLVARVKSFRFAAKNVKTVTVTMPIDLLPS